MKKSAKHCRRPRFRSVKSDRIDQVTRCVCLAIGSTLFLFGVALIAGLIGGKNQATGLVILIGCIPFVVLARWFKKVKIKMMGLEIEAE